MNIEPRFKTFTEDCTKRYPKGYFAAKEKSMKSGGIVLAVMGAVFTLVGLFLLVLGTALVRDVLENSTRMMRKDIMIIVSIFLSSLLFLWVGPSTVWEGIKKFRHSENDWFQMVVEQSGYTESEIREFGRQVSSPGSIAIMLTEIGQPGAIVTEEYLMLELGIPMKFCDIKGAYLVEYPEMVYTGKHMRSVRQMNLAVFSNRWTFCRLQAKSEIAQCVQAMLLEKNPWIDTADGRVLTDKEYDEMEKEYTNKRKS